MAQSALSQQISRLGYELRAPLFVRGKRGAELTPAGELLLPHARRSVADEAWAWAEMVEGVRQGSLDLAVVGIGPDEVPDGLVDPVSVADLLGRGRLIQFAEGTGIRKHVDAAVRQAGFEVSSPFELTQASDMLLFAVLGLGVTIAPRTLAVRLSAAQPAETDQCYVVLGLTDPLAVHPVTVVFERSRLSVLADEFVGLLIQAASSAGSANGGTATAGPPPPQQLEER